MNQYLLEYMGALIISYAIIFGNENPILIGLVHTAVLYIAKSLHLEGQFTPLATFCHLFLNRLDLWEALKIFGTHLLAALSIVFLYKTA